MRIYIYAGYCIPIHAGSLDERPLGGTETGVIRVAQHLRARGHEVAVFSSHGSPPPSDPPYYPARAILNAPPCDILVSVQDWHGCLLPVKARARFFWTGDGAEQYVNYGFGDLRVSRNLAGILSVSEWQRFHLAEESGFPVERIFPIYNGIEPSLFEGSETKVPGRLVYTSAPYRGLALAPEIFLQLKSALPQVELHVFSGLDIYDREKPFEGPERAQYDELRRLFSRLPSCYLHGNVSQPRLARELMRSHLFFYPNTFRETSCISVLEGMAAGLPVVTSDLGALKETVGGCGVTITAQPGSNEYNASFAEACRLLLSDAARMEEMSRRARDKVRSFYTWDRVAKRFEGIAQLALLR